MLDFDPGPTGALAGHFATVPSWAPHRELFWYDWGPIFYRGRLDGSARFLGIASDPGPTERIACRTLVGDAGQRVQGFLAKLGLSHSYVLVNAFPFALHPSRARDALPLLRQEPYRSWENQLLDLVTGTSLQAVVAFGANAQEALAQWDAAPAVPTFKVPHPSSHDTHALLNAWKAAVPQLRTAVTPDPGQDNTGPSYGTSFTEQDYAAIPRADLPFGLPAWFGDDSWGRHAHPRHNNSVDRPSGDADHSLVWTAPSNVP